MGSVAFILKCERKRGVKLMRKRQNILILALKGIIYIYLPIILILFIIYRVILGIDMNLSWDRIIVYAIIIDIWIIRNYIHKSIEQDVKDLSSMKISIMKGRWEITKQGENSLLVKPKFDFPFRLFINNIVQINYSEQRAIIEGPWYYVSNLEKDIKSKSSIWIRRITSIGVFPMIIVLVLMLVLSDLGGRWEIKKSRHNIYIKNVKIIEINSDEVFGNTIENTNNYGFGVENDEYVFYVKDHLNLIRANKDFRHKDYLIQKPSGTGISRLNIAGDWIFYTSGETLNRIRIDGTENEIIYKIGYLLDIHVKDNWIYFINFSDDSNVYRMNINGRNLERFLKVKASDIALYDDRMIFSHEEDGNGYVESINFDGSERKVELEVLVRDLTKWGEYYYYIGDDDRLYMNLINENMAPQILVDDIVSSYIITDAGIFYSLHSDDVGYPGKGVYKIELDGTGNALIVDTDMVEGFTKVGEWLLFHSSDNKLSPGLKRLNVLTNEIKIIE